MLPPTRYRLSYYIIISIAPQIAASSIQPPLVMPASLRLLFVIVQLPERKKMPGLR
jgi:hypothetical protein